MLRAFSDLSIRKKIMTGFSAVILLTVLLAAISLLRISNADRAYTNLQNGIMEGRKVCHEIAREYARTRRNIVMMAYMAENPALYNEARDEFYEKMDLITQLIDKQIHIMVEDHNNSGISIDAEMAVLDELRKLITVDYASMEAKITSAVRNGDISGLYDIITETTPLADQINNILDNFIENISEEAYIISNDTSQQVKADIIVMTATTVIAAVLSIVFAIVISRNISRPLTNLGEAAKKIAEGNLDTVIRSNAKNEIGELSNLFGDVVDIFSLFVERINNTYTLLIDGELDVYLDEDLFPGGYKKAAQAVNKALEYLINNTWEAIHCMKAYGEGDFEATIRRLKGPQSILHESLDMMQYNLKSINSEIKALIESAIAGNLDIRIDSDNYLGDWNIMAEGLNKLLEAVNTPISEVSDVLLSMAKANFDVSVTGDYKGRFNEMKDTVNYMITSTSGYIRDISGILVKMSDRNLDINITKDYEGEFGIIKDALTRIVDTFNRLISDFSSSAEQVSAGATQISESSVSLAQGASQQASYAQELNATIESIALQTRENASNSEKANKLSIKAKNGGIASRREMEEMLKAMLDIEEASKNISKIIKVIEDISFQTNLLSLNAAVEAARAGVNGKGFGVVADEVRRLAGKSKMAAAETAELINKTINIISKGNDLANNTSASINDIVDQITGMAEVIEHVSAASREQDEAVGKIKESIGYISKVTQANASISEESASSAQELSSQAGIFKNELTSFTLRSLLNNSLNRSLYESHSHTLRCSPEARKSFFAFAAPNN